MCSLDLSLPLHSVQKRNQGTNTDHEWAHDWGDSKVVPWKSPEGTKLKLFRKVNIDHESDTALMQRIIRATPRPKYLRDIARNFVEKYLGGGDQMVAIHWRYNHGDWLQHCEKHPSPACTAVLEYVTFDFSVITMVSELLVIPKK